MISEAKKRIVIGNCFNVDCDVDTTIRKAYELGFDRGIQKAAPVIRKDVLKSILEIIDEAQTYKMAVGSTDLFIDREAFREEVLALRGGGRDCERC